MIKIFITKTILVNFQNIPSCQIIINTLIELAYTIYLYYSKTHFKSILKYIFAIIK